MIEELRSVSCNPGGMSNVRQIPRWAQSFRGFTDARHAKRFQKMLVRATATPGKTIAATYKVPAERQAAYDFVEHDTVQPEHVLDVIADATAREAAKHDEVLLVLDGSSLTLADHAKVKEFGSVGTKAAGARGIKVLTNLVCTVDGTPIGCGRFIYWCRADENIDKKKYRPLHHRESHHWHEAIDGAARAFAKLAPQTKLHIVADREADASALLKKVIDEGHEFTIRSSQADRTIWHEGRRINLRRKVRRSVPIAVYDVDVRASSKRRARRARLEVRTAQVDLHLRDHHIGTRVSRPVTVVWAREIGYRGDDRLDWLLFTSKTIKSASDVAAVIGIYTCRWSIEDFHRVWKRGGCDVEKNQLRSPNAVIKWASVNAVLAARAEHLKRRARSEPEAPASSEFTADELEALRIAKKRQKAKTEKLVAGEPTLGVAVRWVADIGGYVGNKSSGAPGATVLSRGLEHLAIYTQALLDVRAEDGTKKR
jgi:hypothetical protein